MSKSTKVNDHAIEHVIMILRGQRVILDSDLAELYKVPTKQLKQAVKRNRNRFPADFLFVLTTTEQKAIRNDSALKGHGQHSKYLSYAFTEQGVAMLSSVLTSKTAIAVNIQIMRVFVRMRALIASYKDLLKKIEKLESNDLAQSESIRNIYQLIKDLLEPAFKNPKQIGFKIP